MSSYIYKEVSLVRGYNMRPDVRLTSIVLLHPKPGRLIQNFDTAIPATGNAKFLLLRYRDFGMKRGAGVTMRFFSVCNLGTDQRSSTLCRRMISRLEAPFSFYVCNLSSSVEVLSRI